MTTHSDTAWPFRAALYDTPNGPLQTYYTGTADRIEAVKRMTDRAQLEAAATLPELQKTVAAAIARRLRQLSPAAKP